MKKTDQRKDKKKKDGMLPILLGIGAIVVVIVVVLLLSMRTRKEEEKQAGRQAVGQTEPETTIGPVTEAADDGELMDYEKSGNIVLGDYSHFQESNKKEDSDDWEQLVWDDYLETCELKSFPDGLVDEALRDTHMQYQRFAEASGMTYAELLEQYGTDEAAVKEMAEDTVKSRMVAKTIASREGWTIDPAKEVDYLLKAMDYEEEDRDTKEVLLKDYYENYGCRPKDDIFVEMAQEFLVERTTEG